MGRGVLSPLNDTENLGRGALLAPDALTLFTPLAPPGFRVPPPGDAFIRFRPGVNKSAALAGLRDRLGFADDVTFDVPGKPADVVNFGQVRRLPEILAGVLGLVAAVTIAYLLVSGIRRRRRDLAVLKTVGFLPRQVSGAIAWTSSE